MRRSAIPRGARPVFVIEAKADDGGLVNMYIERAGDTFYATFSVNGDDVYVRQYSGRNLSALHEELAPLLARPHTSSGKYKAIPAH